MLSSIRQSISSSVNFHGSPILWSRYAEEIIIRVEWTIKKRNRNLSSLVIP